jgi:nitrate/TMAO reductase-like tetraheme cytochrome c subunit
MEKQQKFFIVHARLVTFKKYRVFSVFLLAMLVGCTHLEVEQAFKGELRPGKANKVIGEYCQSCHIHHDFDPPLHVSSVRGLYKKPVFRKARECRSCHYIEKRWMYNQHKRKTRMPEDANRGKFIKFEKKEISRLRKK